MMENDPNMKPMVKPTPQPIKAPILEMHISTLEVAKMGVRVMGLLHWKTFIRSGRMSDKRAWNDDIYA